MKQILPTLIIVILISMTSCSDSKSQSNNFTAKKLVIEKDETARVKELDLSIINKGCGRKWISEGDQPSYERAYCDIIIKYKDSTITAGGNFNPVYIGDIEIDIDRMNPWGVEEDSVPAGGCRVIVRRSPAFILLEKYGWLPEKTLSVSEIAIPDTIRGLPWVQYETCAKGTGFNLATLAGQTMPIIKIQLKEKGKRSGTNIWAHIIIDDDSAVTGWISSQVLAPGLAPLNYAKDQLTNW